MGFDPGFKIGDEISHSDIIKVFHCGNMGGMLPSNTTKTMVIISDYTKGLYQDKLIDNVLHYTGTGKSGEQKLRGNPGYQNGILYNSNENDREIHLFVVTTSPIYKYYGVVRLVDEPYQEIQNGEDGKERLVWMFPVKPIVDIDIGVPEKYATATKMISEIEDSELQNLTILDDKKHYDILIKKHDKYLKSIADEEKELEEVRKKFVEDYPISVIYRLLKEEYVVGLDNDKTFCNRLETGLRLLGSIKGSFSDKFGIFYGKWGEGTTKTYRIKGGVVVDDPDAAFEQIKEKLITLISEAAKDDMNMDVIRRISFQPMFKGKILATYFPQKFPNVFYEEHCDYFLDKIGIKYSEEKDVLDKYELLLQWKNSNPVMQKWSAYGFMKFLYTYFKPISEIKKEREDKQKESDKNYPKEYVAPLKIKVKEWKEMLQSPDIFNEENVELLKRIYQGDNHAKTATELSLEDRRTSKSYYSAVVMLAQRIKEAQNLPPIIGKEGIEVFWRILFWGKYRDDGLFEWKVRPELVKAMEELWPEIITGLEEEEEDRKLVEDVGKVITRIDKADIQSEAKEKPRKETVYSNGHKICPRSRKVSQNALALAEYKCELDEDHWCFNRKNSDIPYTEPHHLVPMAQSYRYKFSLDREQNIVSLCCNCHKQIHLGDGADKLIEKLFEKRKDQVASIGLKNLTLDELKKMYG